MQGSSTLPSSCRRRPSGAMGQVLGGSRWSMRQREFSRQGRGSRSWLRATTSKPGATGSSILLEVTTMPALAGNQLVLTKSVHRPTVPMGAGPTGCGARAAARPRASRQGCKARAQLLALLTGVANSGINNLHRYSGEVFWDPRARRYYRAVRHPLYPLPLLWGGAQHRLEPAAAPEGLGGALVRAPVELVWRAASEGVRHLQEGAIGRGSKCSWWCSDANMSPLVHLLL